MSTDDARRLPPELRVRLEEEAPEEQCELEHVWHLLESGRAATAVRPDADEAWNALQVRLDAGEEPGAPPRRSADRPATRNNRSYRTRQGWGVSLLLVALALGSLWLWQQPERLSAAPGETVEAALPDGSVVELNSGTILSYRRSFQALPFVPAARRAVRLQGEAFFDVAEGERPFIVETFNARIEVLGTRFNVRARPETASRETQVTLASGRVRLAASQETTTRSRAVVLSAPGQSSRVVGAASFPTAPRSTRMERALAWRQRGFAVSNQPLASIFAELERRYAVRITVPAQKTALTDSMTLFYPMPVDVETILHDICVAQGLRYRPTSQGFAVFREVPATIR